MNWADNYKAAKQRARIRRSEAEALADLNFEEDAYATRTDRMLAAAILAIEAQLEAIRLRLDEGIPR